MRIARRVLVSDELRLARGAAIRELGVTYLLYVVGGESGIAIARVDFRLAVDCPVLIARTLEGHTPLPRHHSVNNARRAVCRQRPSGSSSGAYSFHITRGRYASWTRFVADPPAGNRFKRLYDPTLHGRSAAPRSLR